MTYPIGLIDYGMGNLHSVQLAFKRLKKDLKVVRNPSDLRDCDALIAGNLIGSAVSQRSFLAYTRTMERSADQSGLLLLESTQD